MAIAVNSKVWHTSEANLPASNRRQGTVKALITRGGKASAKVLWNGNNAQVTYPLTALIEVPAGY